MGLRPELCASIRPLCGALYELEAQLGTRDARNVLNQELLALTLAQVHSEQKCGQTDGLHSLKRRIDLPSASGLADCHRETCKIDAFQKA